MMARRPVFYQGVKGIDCLVISNQKIHRFQRLIDKLNHKYNLVLNQIEWLDSLPNWLVEK